MRNARRTLSRRQFLRAGAAGIALSAGCGRKPEAIAPEPAAPAILKGPWGGRDRPDIIVYLADSLRADHTSAYGYSKPTTPNIERLAENAVLFEHCYAQSCWTKPSIGALFTGVQPVVHQAVISGENVEALEQFRVQMLRAQFTTLAEALKAAGYRTACLTGNPHTQDTFGFAQGFDYYRFVRIEPPLSQMYFFTEWLRQETGAPVFAFVHQIDPHAPYMPRSSAYEWLHGMTPQQAELEISPEDLRVAAGLRNFYERHEAGSPDGRSGNPADVNPAVTEFVKGFYDAEIVTIDIMLNHLASFLEGTGRMEHTLLVFMSDHGEAFNEHGYFFHANRLVDEEVRVPLLIRAGRGRNGVRIPHNVSMYDLYATLLEVAGAAKPDYLQSRPLLDKTGEPVVAADRPVFAYFDKNVPDPNLWDATLIDGKLKVERTNYSHDLHVYDREADPGETVDLLAQGGEAAAKLAPLLEKFHAIDRENFALAKQFGEPEWTEASEEFREQIEAIGYLR